ncbi:MAG: glycosyltransferase [Patescibacteria group bacterium]
MRILLVTPYFAPAWSFGGPVKVVHDLSKELVSRGHQVTVITTDVLSRGKRNEKRNDLIHGVEVIYFKNVSNYLAFHFNFYFPFSLKSWLSRNIKRYDIIHCHDVFNWLNVHVARKAMESQIPFVVQPHASLDKIRMNAGPRFIKFLFLKFYPYILSSAKAIITSNEHEKSVLFSRQVKQPEQKLFVVPNAVSEEQISKPHHSESFRARQGLQANEKVIIYFGRFQAIKGLDITIRALALLKGFPYKFILIGRDEGMLPRLTTLAAELGIREKLIILEPLFRDKLVEYLSNADLFVLNSKSEGKPLAIMDACAAGLPVIISPGCNMPEVGRYGAGIVLEDNTPQATASAIQRFFSDEKLQMDMRIKCHELIKRQFNLRIIVDQYISIYKQCI